MKADPPTVVVKVGGSLLDWPGLPAELARILNGMGDALVILIAGGGGMADVLRGWDRNHRLGEEAAHALALRVLDVTAHALGSLLGPRARVVVSLDELPAAWSDLAWPILAPRLVLDDDDLAATGEALPHSWDVTTDSIAARVARLVGAAGLILLKSVEVPEPLNPAEAAALGLVDPAFPRAALGLPAVSIVGFRR